MSESARTHRSKRVAVPAQETFVARLRTAMTNMQIDPDNWPLLSRLLDEWFDLPAEAREGWMENLGPEYAGALPILRQLIHSKPPHCPASSCEPCRK